MISTLSLAHTSPRTRVHVAVYRSLQNSRYLRKQLLQGNADFEYAFIDARTILSSAHLLAAVFRAINDCSNNSMKTHNQHSEIVLALSPNNNIGEAFRKFGISDQTRDLIAVKITQDPDQNSSSGDEDPNRSHVAVISQLTAAVQGDSVPFEDPVLAQMADTSEIKKIYKLGSGNTTAAEKQRSQLQQQQQAHGPRDQPDQPDQLDDPNNGKVDLEAAILGAIALRGAT